MVCVPVVYTFAIIFIHLIFTEDLICTTYWYRPLILLEFIKYIWELGGGGSDEEVGNKLINKFR